MKKFLFSGIEPTCKWADLGLTATRVMAGLTLALMHGFKKFPMMENIINSIANAGIPMPTVTAWVVTIIESAGGLLLAAGLFTRTAALCIVLQMYGIFFIVHKNNLTPQGGGELSFMYAAIAIVFLAMGSGRFSLDKFFRRN